jgi:hypothetical protein
MIDGATLQELKDSVRDLRALSQESALADLVEQKISAIESSRNRMPLGFEPGLMKAQAAQSCARST